MKKRTAPVFVGILLLIACNEKNAAPPTKQQNGDSLTVLLGENAEICDTCTCELVVSHSECTECKDLYVENGTVYISHALAKEYDDHYHKWPHTESSLALRKINTRDLYLADSADFKKLWPDWDFRPLKVRGRITGLASGTTPVFKLVSHK